MAFSPHVDERRKATPPIEQRLQFNSRIDPTFFATGVRHRITMWIVNTTSSGMIMFRVVSTTIDAYDIRLVFNRSSLEQGYPMIYARVRPAGDDDDQARALRGGGAKMFGEAQVIADKRRHVEFPYFRNTDAIARDVMVRFAAEC